MIIKKLCSVLLCVSILLVMGMQYAGPAYATQLQVVQTEPPQPNIPEPTEQESRPLETTTPTDVSCETTPPATQPQVTEPVEESSIPKILSKGYEETIPVTQPAATEPQILSFAAMPESQEIAETVPTPDAGAQDGDLGTVAGQGISFRLFNYSTNINKVSGNTAWRPSSTYFTFRSSQIEKGADPSAFDIPTPGVNSDHDQDGFTKNHATVERVLGGGLPILDLTRNADGSGRTDPGVDESTRSLSYLFSSGDHAVTAYAPSNTILQQSGSHYWYDSAEHAVDYDISANRFRLRSYAERNSTTAGYGAAYGDFLPFTYTGGTVTGTTTDGVPYHVESENTDYWFGMTMQVNFFQTKDGKLGNENMVFRFSGDDDVWVFVDDVLVLDLGGTHGTVNGSINFATGEVLQYLSWKGANATEAERLQGSSTSFPTTIRACFDAAGQTPNGGWSTDGRTFADYSEHTLKFFYLERGAAVANCSLDFRLPTLPDESLTVTKDLSPASDETVRDYIADSLSYRFRVMKADSTGVGTDEPFITSGMVYELLENGSKTGTATVGADHSFSLKAGQSAQFTQMLQKGNGASRYVVEEIMPDDLTGQYAGVDYLVSGEGGDTITEDNPAESFTAFRTGVLSAEQTQTVTFRNRVDTAKLGTLKITKLAAPGTQIPPDLFFKMQVILGENPIPAGTQYRVGAELRTVESAGELLLRAGETAVIEQGILSGTTYRVTELSAALDGYRPTYHGTVEPSAGIYCSQDGVSGELPLSGTVHITVTNADYDFAVQIPIYKTVLDYQETGDFVFITEQVIRSADGWETVDILPETAIAVSSGQITEEVLTIGYRSETEGIFYYRITEKRGDGNYLYDESEYIVEVTVTGGSAQVTAVYRNGQETEQVSFVNRAATALIVTKAVSGAETLKKFPFDVEVFLDGAAYSLPDPAEGSSYSVRGNVLSFSLGHGESITLPCIPVGAAVKIAEHDYEGYMVVHMVDGMDETRVSGAERELQFGNQPQTIHFTNYSAFRLPHTGGAGITLYTAGGTLLSLCTGASLAYRRLRKREEEQDSPEV